MEQLIMIGANSVSKRARHNVHNNSGNAGVNKLLALAALLLFALMAAPAQAIVVTYTHTDAQGTVAATSDANRNVTRFGYEPYGMPSSVPEPADAPGYTGHVHDANSGLVYMQQRYYDGETGQFISTDPVGVSASTGANFNRYNYAANNPYRFVDPDGRNPCENGGDDCGTGGGEKKAEKEGAQRSGRGFAAATIQVADRESEGPRMYTEADFNDSAGGESASEGGWSFSSIATDDISISASGTAAAGVGIQGSKGLVNSDSSIDLITPALGLDANVSVNLLEVSYQGSGAETPVRVGFGLDVQGHAVIGARLQIEYSPPTNFNFRLDAGVGAGAAISFYNVGVTVQED